MQKVYLRKSLGKRLSRAFHEMRKVTVHSSKSVLSVKGGLFVLMTSLTPNTELVAWGFVPLVGSHFVGSVARSAQVKAARR